MPASEPDDSPFQPLLDQYPSIEPGGSLLLAWQLRNKHVLIVGGGEVASGRLRSVLEADALVTLISPSSGLHSEVRYRIFHDPYSKGRITYHDRTFQLPTTSLSESTSSTTETVSEFHDFDDLEGIDFVLTAIDDVTVSKFIYELAHSRHIPTNVADIPPSCDFFFGSQIRSGPLQVMVSTNGKGPKIASIVRKKLEEHVNSLAPGSGGIGRVVENVGALRERLRARAPGVGGLVSKKRMRWMSELCEKWSLEELGMLEDEMMDYLLDHGWEKGGKVPPFEVVAGVENVATSAFTRVLEWATLDHGVHLLVGATIGAAASYTALRLLR